MEPNLASSTIGREGWKSSRFRLAIILNKLYIKHRNLSLDEKLTLGAPPFPPTSWFWDRWRKYRDLSLFPRYPCLAQSYEL